MAEILPIRRKKPFNQSINQSNSKRSIHLFLPAVVTDDFFNKPQKCASSAFQHTVHI